MSVSKTVNLSRYIENDGQVDPDTGLAFSLPLDATQPVVTATSIANLPSSGNDFGRIGVVYENGSEEGKMVFWDGSSWGDQVVYTEIGGAQDPPTLQIAAATSPNFGSQYYNISVTLEIINNSNSKDVGEDPISSYTWATGGQSVSTGSNGGTTFTIYYPTITTDQNTTVTCTTTDPQGDTAISNTVTIQWRANASPTITGFTTNKGSTTGNAPEPGETVTLTVTGTDPESATLEYYVTKTSGASVTTNPSLATWTTDNTFTFTVPEIDDGVNDYNELVFEAKVRDGSNVESTTLSETVYYKRARRTAEEIEIVGYQENQRNPSDSSKGATSAQPSYPTGIQSGDVLVMFVSAYAAPSFTTWDGISVGGSAVALHGDDLNNSSNTGYSSSALPNTYRGSPTIVSSQGWERAYQTGSGGSQSTTPSTYRRSFSGTHLFKAGGSQLNTTAIRETFYKICDGTESGTINVWDDFDASYGYAHAHVGENTTIFHLRAKTVANVKASVSSIIQIYANPDAWNRGSAIVMTSTNYHETFTLNQTNYDANPILIYTHCNAGGNSSNIIEYGSNTGLNDGLYTNSYTDYELEVNAFKSGDNSPPSDDGVNYMQEYVVGNKTLRVDGSECWYNSTGSTEATESLGTGGGEYVYALHAVQLTSINGSDVENGSSRTIRWRHTKRLSGTTNRLSNGNVGLLQFISEDPLYP